MMHDIGTTERNLTCTRLSYEFWAGVHVLQILQDSSRTTGGDAVVGTQSEATREQAESVCEAIIRHQDVQYKGSITLLTRLIHLGTLSDNIGAGGEMVNEETVRNVNEKYERRGWSGCFKDVVEREKREKPVSCTKTKISCRGMGTNRNASMLWSVGSRALRMLSWQTT